MKSTTIEAPVKKATPGKSGMGARVAEAPGEAERLEKEKLKARRIRQTIRGEEKKLRERHGWLRHQDAIGMGIFLFSLLGMAGAGAAWLAGWIPGWSVILINGILASFLHELEHDLIHNMYFSGKQKVQNAMFWGVWLARGNIISPWYRKKIHLLHHKVSGTREDIEERMIGNGRPYNLARWMVMLDGTLSFLLNNRVMRKEAPQYRTREITGSILPVTLVFNIFYHSLLAGSLTWVVLSLTGNLAIWESALAAVPGLSTVISVWLAVAVIWVIPNVIRQAALQIVSSSMHYFHNVDSVYRQTQVMNHWALFPLHLFCFNFGSTHGMHHYVVNQPFYIRQMIVRPVHLAMKKEGVPFNDFGTLKRANAFRTEAAA